MQLAEVGDARVGVEVGLQVDHPLERALGGVVAAELDLRVDDHAVGLHDSRRRGACALAVTQAGAEVVARVRERAHARERSRVVRLALERGAQRRLGARVLRGVGGLACLLQVRVAERRIGLGRGGVRFGSPSCRERMRWSVDRASAIPAAPPLAPAPAVLLPEGLSMSFTAVKVAANTNSGTTRSLIRFGLVRGKFMVGVGPEWGPLRERPPSGAAPMAWRSPS